MHNRAAFAALIFLFLRVELRFSQKRKNVTLCQEGAGDGSHPWTWVAQKYTPFLGGRKKLSRAANAACFFSRFSAGRKAHPHAGTKNPVFYII